MGEPRRVGGDGVGVKQSVAGGESEQKEGHRDGCYDLEQGIETDLGIL